MTTTAQQIKEVQGRAAEEGTSLARSFCTLLCGDGWEITPEAGDVADELVMERVIWADPASLAGGESTWTARALDGHLHTRLWVFDDGSAIVLGDAGVWSIVDDETHTREADVLMSGDDGIGIYTEVCAIDDGDCPHPLSLLAEVGCVGPHAPGHVDAKGR